MPTCCRLILVDLSLAPFDQAWVDAVAKYKIDTGVDTSSSSEFPDVDSVEGLFVVFNVNRDGPNPRKIEGVLNRRVLCHDFQDDIRQLFEELRGSVELVSRNKGILMYSSTLDTPFV
jgi:hypothetical protein